MSCILGTFTVVSKRLGVLSVTTRSPRSTDQAKAAAAALVENNHRWAEAVAKGFAPGFIWLNAPKVHAIEFNSLSAFAGKKDFGPFGIWWSSGYEIRRVNTNTTVWTLYRVRSFGGPSLKGIRWRSKLTTVTNSP